MDRDSLRIVAEDLDYLRTWGSEMSDGEIRRGSAVLRRLLIENVYGVAWRAVGEQKQPTVMAVDLKLVLGDQLPNMLYGIAAGVHFRGIQMSTLMMHKGSQPARFHSPPTRPDGYPGERMFSLSEYLSSLSGVVEGRTFTRQEVVKYIANVKGGVHLNAKERKKEVKLVARLAKIEKKLTVQNTDGLLIEIAAIGQTIGRSADSAKLVASIGAI